MPSAVRLGFTAAICAFLVGCGAHTSSALEEQLHEGTVLVRTYRAEAQPTATVRASFAKSRMNKCERRELAENCLVTTCSNGADELALANNGTLHAAFADSGPTLDVAPSSTLRYDAASPLPDGVPHTGTFLKIDSTGADVPAWNATLVVPPPLMLDAPPESRAVAGATSGRDALARIVSADRDLELRFSNALAGERLALSTDSGSGTSSQSVLSCELEITNGTVVVPANVLAAVRTRRVYLTAATIESLRVDDWNVKVGLGGDVWAPVLLGNQPAVVPFELDVQ